MASPKIFSCSIWGWTNSETQVGINSQNERRQHHQVHHHRLSPPINQSRSKETHVFPLSSCTLKRFPDGWRRRISKTVSFSNCWIEDTHCSLAIFNKQSSLFVGEMWVAWTLWKWKGMNKTYHWNCWHLLSQAFLQWVWFRDRSKPGAKSWEILPVRRPFMN